MMRGVTILILASLICFAYAQAPPKPRPVQTATQKILDCDQVPGLKKPILKQMGQAVRCRLEVRDLTCLPGLKIKVDVTGDIDLCITSDGRPLGEPTCQPKNRKRYAQEIVQRGRFMVDRPNQKPVFEWLDLPFTMSSRMEVLGQRKPIVLKGPDACVYLRNTTLLLGRQIPTAAPKPAEK